MSSSNDKQELEDSLFYVGYIYCPKCGKRGKPGERTVTRIYPDSGLRKCFICGHIFMYHGVPNT